MTASTAPRPKPGWLVPLRVVNVPPATSLLRSGAMTKALTRPSPALGRHGRRLPSEARAAANLDLEVDPTELNEPPRYTVSGVATMARTEDDIAGAQPGIVAPVFGFRATTLLAALRSPG